MLVSLVGRPGCLSTSCLPAESGIVASCFGVAAIGVSIVHDPGSTAHDGLDLRSTVHTAEGRLRPVVHLAVSGAALGAPLDGPLLHPPWTGALWAGPATATRPPNRYNRHGGGGGGGGGSNGGSSERASPSGLAGRGPTPWGVRIRRTKRHESRDLFLDVETKHRILCLYGSPSAEGHARDSREAVTAIEGR